jgi:hypothetical protein
LPTITQWKRKAMGVKAPEQKLQILFDVLSYNLGIKLKELDLIKERDRQAWDLMAKAEKERLRKKHLQPSYVRTQRPRYIARELRRQQKVGLR